jgi:hypothetical protein
MLVHWLRFFLGFQFVTAGNVFLFLPMIQKRKKPIKTLTRPLEQIKVNAISYYMRPEQDKIHGHMHYLLFNQYIFGLPNNGKWFIQIEGWSSPSCQDNTTISHVIQLSNYNRNISNLCHKVWSSLLHYL